MPNHVQKITMAPGVAAFLQAWRCPVITDPGEDDRLGGPLTDWGVLLRGTVVVGESGVVHAAACPEAGSSPRVRLADLLRITAEHCERCPHVEAVAPTAARPGPADHQLEELMRRLDSAVAVLPAEAAAGCADRRTMLLCAAFGKATTRFQGTSAVPPRLEAALSRFNRWLTRSSDSARGRLRTDGLQRLQDRMRHHYGLPALTAADRRQLAGAGGPSDWAVCMFAQMTAYADVAAVSAPVGATAEPENGRSRTAHRAVAVLPRELAEYLLGDYAAQWLTARVPTGAMTIASWVPDASPELQATAEAALAIWGVDGADPASAWHTARIVTH